MNSDQMWVTLVSPSPSVVSSLNLRLRGLLILLSQLDHPSRQNVQYQATGKSQQISTSNAKTLGLSHHWDHEDEHFAHSLHFTARFAVT